MGNRSKEQKFLYKNVNRILKEKVLYILYLMFVIKRGFGKKFGKVNFFDL